MEVFLLIIIGLVAGTLGSLVGLGGGVIIVPTLMFFATYTNLLQDATPQVAVGTSLLVLIFTGLSSTLAYMKYKTVDYKSGLIFFIGSGPGGILGAWINKSLDFSSFSIYFGIFMIFSAVILFFRDRVKPRERKNNSGITRTFKDSEGVESIYGYHPIQAILITFFIGTLAGLFGIGGGSLLVPAMIMLFAFPPHVAVATSMFMIFLASGTSSITHIFFGNINWIYALFLIPGAWFGARLGAFINSKIKGKTIVVILRIVLVLLGIRLIYQGIVS